MSYACFYCKAAIDQDTALKAGRRDECPKCKSDLHVCKNCKFYDSSAYNQCREPQAERVVDKDKANFCDFFDYSSSDLTAVKQKSDYLKDLDNLFK